jgi:NADH-quinone oxidoreductase subunit J
MIGAIVLTLRERPGTLRQDVAAQINRAGTVNLRSVPSGAGLASLGIERPPAPEEQRAPAAIAHEGHGGGHH